jgi:hypothetical protein
MILYAFFCSPLQVFAVPQRRSNESAMFFDANEGDVVAGRPPPHENVVGEKVRIL